MQTNFKLASELLKPIEDTTLFYPCSGDDLVDPIRLFAPTVIDFWFVDVKYFTSEPADKAEAVLSGDINYKLVESNIIDGPPLAIMTTKTDPNTGKQYPYLEPCILTETYQHTHSGRIVRIHRRRGFGFCAFKKYIPSLGVFFYRCDSPGDGGSGNLWLIPVRIRSILNKLRSGGFIVTDGSQHGLSKHGEDEELWKYRWTQDGEEAMTSVKAFKDKQGNTFTCVGYAGQGYGPTLIWKVIKPT